MSAPAKAALQACLERDLAPLLTNKLADGGRCCSSEPEATASGCSKGQHARAAPNFAASAPARTSSASSSALTEGLDEEATSSMEGVEEDSAAVKRARLSAERVHQATQRAQQAAIEHELTVVWKSFEQKEQALQQERQQNQQIQRHRTQQLQSSNSQLKECQGVLAQREAQMISLGQSVAAAQQRCNQLEQQSADHKLEMAAQVQAARRSVEQAHREAKQQRDEAERQLAAVQQNHDQHNQQVLLQHQAELSTRNMQLKKLKQQRTQAVTAVADVQQSRDQLAQELAECKRQLAAKRLEAEQREQRDKHDKEAAAQLEHKRAKLFSDMQAKMNEFSRLNQQA